MADWIDALADAGRQWEWALAGIGWHHLVFAIAYATAGTLCCLAAAVARRSGGTGAGWNAAAALLVLLGVNSMLRFDLLALYALRAVARAHGWYAHRRAIQEVALALLVAGSGAALFALRTRLVPLWRRCEFAAAGLGLLVAVALVRAVSLHYTDRALDAHVAGVSVGRLLEFAGIGLTAAGALRWSRGA